MTVLRWDRRAWILALLSVAACVGTEAQRTVQEGNDLLAQDRIEEALDAYRRAQEIDPGPADAHLGEGLALYRMQHYAEAETALRRALERDAEEAQHHVYLGHVLSRLERSEEAVETYLEATRLAPIQPDGWRGLGITLYNLGRGAEARVALEKYLAFAPNASDRSAIAGLIRALPGSSGAEE